MDYLVGVELDLLNKTISCLEGTIENAAALLCAHNAMLGRTTDKNKHLSEMYGKEIQEIKSIISALRMAREQQPKPINHKDERDEDDKLSGLVCQ